MRKPPKIISILVLVSFLTYPVRLHAEDVLPQGAVNVVGNSSYDYSQAGTLNVNVGANQNIANWQSYSVGAGNAVNYNRDSAFTFLNRVVGSDPSNIFGSINAANGKIFLINQSGILFAPGSSVNAAGLTASTLDIQDADFLAGRYTFFGKGGSVVSQGYISTPGGYVALLGSTVENAGVIEANLGKVVLASGERITLGLDALDLISVVIDEATSQNLENKDAAVHNIGKITANGGKVILTAKTLDGVFKKAANNEGVIEAKSLVSKKGEVYLLGNMENDLVSNTGTIDVSASDVGVDGGFVELSAHEIDFASGTIDNRSAFGKTGEVLLDPWDLIINDATALWLEHSTYGNVTLQADNDISLVMLFHTLDLEYYGPNEYFKLEAGRNINLRDNHIVTHGADIILHADAPFWFKSGVMYPKQWVNTADGIGSINLGSGSLKSNGGDIELKAGQDINFGTGSINSSGSSSGGKVTLVADASYSYEGHEATDDGTLHWHDTRWVKDHLDWSWSEGLHWDGYWVEGHWDGISLPVYSASGSAKTSDGIGDINLGNGNGIITNGGAADLSAVNIYATEDILTAGGTLTLKATKDIEVKGNLDAGAGQGTLTAGDDILVKDHGRIAAGDLTMSSVDDTTIEDHALIDVVNRLIMSVGDDFKMKDSGAIKAGSADITTGDTYLYNDADIDIRGIFNITAQDMIMNDSSDIDANIVNILTGRDFLMYGSSDIGDDGDNFSTYINAGRNVRISNHSIDTDFATVYAGNDISLGKIFATFHIDLSAGGDILDNNLWDMNLTTDNLYMKAGGTIGELGAAIETDVNDIWATANNGDVRLNERDGVNLWDIQALGSTIDIVTGGDTNAYLMYASGSGLWDPAIVNLTVNHGELNVLGKGIKADRSGEGLALVNLIADGDINVYSHISTETGSGKFSASKIDLKSRWDDINIDDADVQALVYGNGHAEVSLDAKDDVDIIHGSSVIAQTGYGSDTALVNIHADDDINIKNHSAVWALVDHDGNAYINMDAKDNILVSKSEVESRVGGWGDATNNLHAKNIIITKGGEVEAKAHRGEAENNLGAKNIIITKGGEVSAKSIHGDAENNLGAKNIIITKGGEVKAKSIFDDAKNELQAKNIIITKGGEVKAKSIFDDATNKLSAKNISISKGGTVKAESHRGDATNILTAKNIIVSKGGQVTAESVHGDAVNMLFAKMIIITKGALVQAKSIFDDAKNWLSAKLIVVTKGGEVKAKSIFDDATNNLTAKNIIITKGGEVKAESIKRGDATNNLHAKNIIITKGGEVEAKAHRGEAENNLGAKNIIITKGGEVSAKSIHGDAENHLFAKEDIELNRGTVKAESFSGKAENTLFAGDDISLVFSKVLSKTIFGIAKVTLDARDDISLFFSSLTAKVLSGKRGHAEVTLDAGSKHNHHGNITLTGSSILAEVGSGLRSALVVLNATGMINLAFSTVEAVNNNFGRSSVYFNAGKDINLFASKVTARTGFGDAVVDLDARNDINLTFSKILAKAIYGSAKVVLDAKDDISLFFSNLIAKVRGDRGYAEVTLDAGSKHNHHGDITISNSKVMAKVNGVGHAEVNLKATDDIDIKHSSKILAKTGFGGYSDDVPSTALITLIAGDDINLSHSSKIKAISHNFTPAAVLALAGDDINAYGKISAISDYGFAGVALLAIDNIYAGNVLARGNASPDAIGVLEYLGEWLAGFPIDIAAQFDYSSGILLGSLAGDITLGLIRADAVIAAALGGSIWDATNAEEAIIGDVHANYLGLLARYSIGTGKNPINTFVNILSGYSWDTGDIYINNIGKSLQLGLYLPIFGLLPEIGPAQIGAIGASVAANNGIIHVVSDGDIIVNSVISPRGGVYLETTDGSIYAGRGWCPVVSQSDLDGLPFSDFIGEALMGMDGTEWSSVAGVDYFSPVMFALMPLTGTNDLPLGPNVIAGGYSYFSAINGTIGVGAYNDLSVGLFDNPLKVDIQVLSENLGGNNSALPGGGTAVAGLTLKIGGGKGSYDDGYNGPLPVSGVIEGLVRPGTTMNGVNPSPALDLTGVTTGYVFYNDSDTSYGKDCPGCTITLDGSSVRNRGLEQIYPNIPSGFGNLINQLAIDPRIRNIYHPSFRTVSIDRQTPTGTYFYHPLVLSDSSAFDEIALNAGAYDFIDGNLDLKGDNTFSPFYQNDNGKKKNKGKS